jgi:hypothetical protein
MHSELRTAIEQGQLPAVIAALNNGADIEERDVHGDAGLPLRTACFLGKLTIVAELLKRGANIHAPNGQGSSAPIRLASRGKHDEIVALLIEHGAQRLLEHDAQPSIDKQGQQPDVVDRRRRSNRRTFDFGPQNGLKERRSAEDRRATLVREVELSECQWSAYFAPEGARQAHNDNTFEAAALVFSRARD